MLRSGSACWPARLQSTGFQNEHQPPASLTVLPMPPPPPVPPSHRFVCDLLGLPALAPPPLSLAQLISSLPAHSGAARPGGSGAASRGERGAAAGGGAVAPLLLITTPGADPSVELAEVAAASAGRGALREVAMGQGQAGAALALLRGCAANGGWAGRGGVVVGGKAESQGSQPHGWAR
jgi:hypothetical protein